MINLTDYPLKIKLLLVPAIAVVSFVVYLIYSSLVLSGGDELLKQIRNSQFPRLYAAGENIKSFDEILKINYQFKSLISLTLMYTLRPTF